MSTTRDTAAAADSEKERQRLLEDLAADNGSEWAAQFKPGTFGCHELLDRTGLIADMLERDVISHPACVQNREWFELAEQAAAAIHELYQRVGNAHLSHNTVASRRSDS
jgi:hypothetical protein